MSKKTPETEIAVISKEVGSLQKKAESVTIKSQEDLEGATVFLSEVKKKADSIEAGRQFFVQPLNEQVKKINAMFKEQSEPLARALTIVKRAISDYTLEQERKAQAEEKRKQDIRDKANAKREEEGKGAILDPIKSVERAAPTVSTSAGRSTTRKVWKFEVVDAKKVPRQYCAPVDKLIRDAVAAGSREIDGVRIYEDVVVSVSAN